MKIIRCIFEQMPYYAFIEGETARIFKEIVPGNIEVIAEQPLTEIELICPTSPRNIICVGLNYQDHANEMNMPIPEEPLLFSKAATSVIGHGQSIQLNPLSNQIEYEGELVVVIGRLARKVTEANWREVILGFTCGNDVTARDLQRKDKQFFRAKSFDTFAAVGPWLETDLDPANLKITTKVNGILKQKSNTNQLIFSVPKIIAHITSFMTLHPGDVIFTGTPAGVGPLQLGDKVEVEIEGIGTLQNNVK